MGRELKRVPLDFNHPLRTVWPGYINTLGDGHVTDCAACSGKGGSPEYQHLYQQWYGSLYPETGFYPHLTGSVEFQPDHPAIVRQVAHKQATAPEFYGTSPAAARREAMRLCDLFNAAWSHHLDADDVAALITAGRLMDFTHVPRTPEQEEIVRAKIAGGGNSWLPESNGYVPAPQEVNEWSISGFGHDSINAWICTEAKCKRLGLPVDCAVCQGEGSFWDAPENKAAFEAWAQTEPPVGDGFQMWETVSEGAPISPVFATAELLAAWLGKHESRDGNYDQWLAMIHEGWAPSGISTPETGFLSGVAAVAAQHGVQP
jgi:hypothetical protein